MQLRRMLALTLVLMTLMTAALAADDPGLYYIGDDATPENLTGHTQVYNAVDATPGWRYGFVAYLTDGTRVYSDSSAAQEGAVSFDIPEDAVSVLRRAGRAGKLSGARVGQRRIDRCADAV